MRNESKTSDLFYKPHTENQCNPASIDCCVRNCHACLGSDQIKNILENVFQSNIIEKKKKYCQ